MAREMTALDYEAIEVHLNGIVMAAEESAKLLSRQRRRLRVSTTAHL